MKRYREESLKDLKQLAEELAYEVMNTEYYELEVEILTEKFLKILKNEI